MPENPGIAPPVAGTDIYDLRYLIPDYNYIPLDPPVVGQGSYTWFPDVQLAVYLDRAGNDVDKAAVYAWRAIGDYYASQSVSIKTDDLSVSEPWRRAQFFYDRADKAEASFNADIFVMAPVGESCSCSCHELAESGYCGSCACAW